VPQVLLVSRCDHCYFSIMNWEWASRGMADKHCVSSPFNSTTLPLVKCKVTSIQSGNALFSIPYGLSKAVLIQSPVQPNGFDCGVNLGKVSLI
jgi:hypothetical protein